MTDPTTTSDIDPPTEEIGADHDAAVAADAPVSFGLQSRDVVPVVMLLAGAVAVMSGQQPTGNLLADIVLSFFFGAGVVWFGAHASPQSLIASSVLALFFTGLESPALLYALGAVLVALAITSWRRFERESWRIGASVSAALTTLAVLNLSNIRYSGSASLLAALAIAPLVATGWSNVPSELRRKVTVALVAMAVYSIVATALSGFVALNARDDVELGITQAEDGVTAIEFGDQPQAIAQLEAAEENFERAHDKLGGPLTWPARFVPITAQHARALETAADQGTSLASTAVRTVTRADVEEIRGQNGQIDLDLVQDVHTELTTANLTLRAAQESLLSVRSPWLLPLLSSRLDSVQEELVATAEDIDLANHATAVLPDILGAQGPRQYMVLFAQPAESREFGGFVGAYALLRTDQGRFSLTESGSIDTDFGLGQAEFEDPGVIPEPYFVVAPHLNPQNLTATADLPSIATAVRELAPQWRQDPEFVVDGVIVMDPYALGGLLELTGPVTVDGRAEPVDATNVAEFLLRGQYLEFDADRSARQDMLKVLAAEAFDRLLTIEVPGPEQLGAIFGPLARANRISMITYDETENAFLDRIFLSADLPQVGSSVDMLGVFGQTATASKLDGYATRDVTYDVLFDPATGVIDAQLEVIEYNDAPEGASDFVLGYDEIHGPDGDLVKVGDNYLGLSIYTRATMSDLQADTSFFTGVPIPALTYDRTTLFFQVPQGGSATATATLTATVEPGRYDLFVPAQATANLASFTLNLTPAPGWRVAGEGVANDGSWSQTVDMDEPRGFSFLFERTG